VKAGAGWSPLTTAALTGDTTMTIDTNAPVTQPTNDQPSTYCVVVPHNRSLKYTAQDASRPGVITHYNGHPILKTPTSPPAYKWLVSRPGDTAETAHLIQRATDHLQGLIDMRAEDVVYDDAYYRHYRAIHTARKDAGKPAKVSQPAGPTNMQVTPPAPKAASPKRGRKLAPPTVAQLAAMGGITALVQLKKAEGGGL
jgi:hypothetical protein